MHDPSAHDILIELLGAVALLLWGTRMVRTGVQRAFGAELRHLLRVSLTNRFAALLAGIGVTGVLQSSTATALVVASFAGRNLVETAPAFAVMLGADIGTTLVAQVLSLDVHGLAPIMILTGVAIYLGAEASPYRELGRVALGLGLMLLALTSRDYTWDMIALRGRFGPDVAAVDRALEETFSRYAVDPSSGGVSARCGRSSSTCVRGSRGSCCGAVCWAETSVYPLPL